jgi:hypothetical protein
MASYTQTKISDSNVHIKIWLYKAFIFQKYNHSFLNRCWLTTLSTKYINTGMFDTVNIKYSMQIYWEWIWFTHSSSRSRFSKKIKLSTIIVCCRDQQVKASNISFKIKLRKWHRLLIKIENSFAINSKISMSQTIFYFQICRELIISVIIGIRDWTFIKFLVILM